MISSQQAGHFLNQLQAQYPEAFKKNFILYGQIKTKGIMDEKKEIIPFLLSLLIFIPLAYLISEIIHSHFIEFDSFQANATANIIIMLFLMLICPLVLKQIKHSSHSLYANLKHTPFKLTILIILQAINLAFIESWILSAIYFFFTLSFGFVKFYKENMFRPKTTSEHYYHIQEFRRICFWSYKKSVVAYVKLKFTSKSSEKYRKLVEQKKNYAKLYTQLYNFENKLCLSYKHVDIETYIDSIM